MAEQHNRTAKHGGVLLGVIGLALVTAGASLPWRLQVLPALPGIAYASPRPAALTAHDLPLWGTSLGMWLIGLASIGALSSLARLGAHRDAAGLVGLGSAATALGLIVVEPSLLLGPVMAAVGLALQLVGAVGLGEGRGG